MTNITNEMRARVARARGWKRFSPGGFVHKGEILRVENWSRGEEKRATAPPYDTNSELMLELMKAAKISIYHSSSEESDKPWFTSVWSGFEFAESELVESPPKAVFLAYLAWLDAQEVE